MVYAVDFIVGDDCKRSVRVRARDELRALAKALDEIDVSVWVLSRGHRVHIAPVGAKESGDARATG